MFKRKGDHVEVEVPLTIPEALRGGNIEVPTLAGRKTLKVPPGTRPGSPLPARRMRLPSRTPAGIDTR